jgi:hypothetical protein
MATHKAEDGTGGMDAFILSNQERARAEVCRAPCFRLQFTPCFRRMPATDFPTLLPPSWLKPTVMFLVRKSLGLVACGCALYD